jgi:zinc and cadmium transporter
MVGATFYTIISVIIVSLISLVGALSFIRKKSNLTHHLLLFVSVSAGTLFGGVFIHILPEAVERIGFGMQVSLLVLAGIIVFFLLEKFIHWRHCHGHDPGHHETKPSHIAPLNLLGDGIHNFLDGLIIAAAYLVSIPAGIATTVAVIFHEIPQEIADFGVLLYSGLSKWKALFFNFLSATVAILGAIIGLSFGTDGFINFVLPFAAGGFVYIAGSNLIPELHKECGLKDSLWHFIAMLLGLFLMYLLTFIG